MSKTIHLVKGDTLIKEGDTSKSLYLIQSGTMKVYKNSGPQQVLLGTLRKGELVGEMSFIDQSRRSASVSAACDCTIVEISSEKFESYFSSQPIWWQALLKTLVSRIRVANKKIHI